MSSEKKYNFISKLYDKSDQGKVPWEETADPNRFHALLGTNVVELTSNLAFGFENTVSLAILDEDGDVLDTVADSKTNPDLEQLLRSMFATARSYARGTEKALDSMIAFLNKDDWDDVPF